MMVQVELLKNLSSCFNENYVEEPDECEVNQEDVKEDADTGATPPI